MNKRTFFLLLFVMGLLQAKDLVQWRTFDQAILEAKQDTNKLLMIDVYTVWCRPCAIMASRTLNHPEVAEIINKYFIPVKFNAEGNEVVHFFQQEVINKNYDEAKSNTRNSTHDFTYFLANTQRGIAYPTITFLSHDGKEREPVQGVIQPRTFAYLLYFVAEKEHQNKSTNLQSYINKYPNKVKIQE